MIFFSTLSLSFYCHVFVYLFSVKHELKGVLNYRGRNWTPLPIDVTDIAMETSQTSLIDHHKPWQTSFSDRHRHLDNTPSHFDLILADESSRVSSICSIDLY
jgi:hypothetical protein